MALIVCAQRILLQKPLKLLERIIAASTDEGDLVLDPFSGSATTGIAAAIMNRRSVGLELETKFLELSKKRYRREYLEHPPSASLAYERETNAQVMEQAKEIKAGPRKLFAER